MSVGNLSRQSQAERRARSRAALLETAARGLSRYGYGNLVLERVAADAGYTRGALYHQFAGKEDLALAVVGWIGETWYAEVGHLAEGGTDAVDTLLAIARGHAVYCRRDVAGAMMTLRVEFSGRDHPVGRAVEAGIDRFTTDLARLISAGRRSGAIPPGPPARLVARGYVGALEGLTIGLAGRAPHDVALAERLARGLLGLPPDGQPVSAS